MLLSNFCPFHFLLSSLPSLPLSTIPCGFLPALQGHLAFLRPFPRRPQSPAAQLPLAGTGHLPVPQLQRRLGKQVSDILSFHKGTWALPKRKKGQEVSVGKAAQGAGHCGLAGGGTGLLWTPVVYLTERAPEPGEWAAYSWSGEDLLECGQGPGRRRLALSGSWSGALSRAGEGAR